MQRGLFGENMQALFQSGAHHYTVVKGAGGGGNVVVNLSETRSSEQHEHIFRCTFQPQFILVCMIDHSLVLSRGFHVQ